MSGLEIALSITTILEGGIIVLIIVMASLQITKRDYENQRLRIDLGLEKLKSQKLRIQIGNIKERTSKLIGDQDVQKNG